MASAPLAFPGSAAELPGMSNAQLVQLVKQEGVDHPQGKSLAHFMTKADKVAYLGAQHYATGAEIGHVIPNAEAKYADFLAKAKAKDEAKKAAQSLGTNCSATAMKDLESAVAEVASVGGMNQLDVIQGDMVSFFVDHPQLTDTATNAGIMQQFVSQIKALPGSVLLGPQEELANTLVETAKLVRNVIDDLPGLAQSGDVLKTLKYAEQLDNAVPIYGGVTQPIGDGLKILSSEVKAQAESTSKDYLVDKLQSSGYLTVPTDVNGNLAVLKDLSTVEPKMLTAQMQTALDQAVQQTALGAYKALIDVTAEPSTPGTLDALVQAAGDAKKVVQSTKATEYLDQVAKIAEHQAAQPQWEQFVSDFEGLKNVDLKKLAYDELSDHGFQKSLGSFLTKDEKVELLAKFKADAPVDDLVAKAKEKYLVKEGKAPAEAAKDVVDISVKTPEVKAAEAVVDQTKPEFDLLKAIDGQEHLAPADEHLVIETEPHPAAKVNHVFTPTGTGPTGGSHPMEIFLDENGEKWLFKAQETWQSDVEDWAAEVGQQLGLNVTEVRVNAQMQVTPYLRRQDIAKVLSDDGKTLSGSFQRMLPNTGEVGKEGGALGKLTEQQVADMQRQQVYDWLISNHDTHGENMLIGLDGGLVPIDKGQAMKFFGTDSLGPTYSPNASQPVYNRLWAEVIKGNIKVDFDAIDEILTRVEQLDDKQFEELLREKFADKFANKQRVINAYQSADTRTLDSFVEKALERKQSIRADFEAFYKDLSRRSGVEWTPKWAPRVEQAEKIVEPAAKLAVKGDIATPVDQALADAIRETGAAGKALHLAGEEVNEHQALVWQETGVDGKPILRMELRLENQADARVTKVFEAHAGVPMGGASNAPVVGLDADFNAIQQAAKTINHHADDGAYNQAKLDKMIEVNTKILDQKIGPIAKAAEADEKLKVGEITVDEWAQLKAEGDAGAHYKQVINDLQDGINYQHKVEKVFPYDINAAKQEWLTKAPDVKGVVKPVKSEPPKLFEKVSVGTERRPMTVDGPGYMERVRTNDWLVPNVSSNYIPAGEVQITQGKQFEGLMKVGDQKVNVTWSSWGMTSSVPGKSRMTLEIADWDGTEAGVKTMLEALNKLGVDSHLATQEEERLAYWETRTGQMKNSVEYARPNQASDNFIGLRNTIDTIEQRLSAEALDTQGKIDVYREEFAKQFGQDAVDRAPEAISHIHDLAGREVGFGHFDRFETPTDLRPYFQKSGKRWGISRRSAVSPDVFSRSAVSSGNGEKYRIGQKMEGASVPADLGSGGATGAMASPGITMWQDTGPMIVFNPSSVMSRGSTYGYGGDGFGSMWERGSRNYLNPTGWQSYIGTGLGHSTTEIVARHGYSFYDDMELIMARSQTEKDAIVKVFRDQGADVLRGINIEDRVVVATNRDMPKIIDSWFREHPDAYTHSLSNPVDLQPGAKAAKFTPPPPPPAVVSSVKGSAAAEKEALSQSLSNWGNTTNSTKAKLDDLTYKLQSAGVKVTSSGIKQEFAQWWDATGQYKGISQVKSTKYFISAKLKETEVKAAVEGLTKGLDKISAIKDLPSSPAKQQIVAEVFGKPFTEVVDVYKATEPGLAYGEPFNNWLVQEAAKIDAAAPAQALGKVEIKGLGQVDLQVLKDVASNPNLTISGKLNALEANLNIDFEQLQSTIQAKKFEGIANGVIDTNSTGQMSQALNLLIKEAEESASAPVAAGTADTVSVQIIGVLDKTKAQALQDLVDTGKPLHVADIKSALGLQSTTSQAAVQDALEKYADAVGLNKYDVNVNADVVKAILDEAKTKGLAVAEKQPEGLVYFPGAGNITTQDLAAIVNDTGLGMGEKVQAIAQKIGVDYMKVNDAVVGQMEGYAKAGEITQGPGQVSATLNKMLQNAKAAATQPEGFKLGDLGVIPIDKLEALVGDNVMSAAHKAGEIGKLLGQDDLSAVLQEFIKVKDSFGTTGTQDTLQAMLDSVKAAAPAPVAPAGSLDSVTVGEKVKVFINSDIASALKDVVDIADVGATDELPVYTKDVANALGLSQPSTQTILETYAQEVGLQGEGWGKVVQEMLHEAENAGLKIEAKAAVEVAPKVEQFHPGFSAYKVAGAPSGSMEIQTPLGVLSEPAKLNDISDAVTAINAGQPVVDTLNTMGDLLGTGTYGDMLPTLDAYAKDIGMGGFPGSDPAEVLEKFVQDSGHALGDALAKNTTAPSAVQSLGQQFASTPNLLAPANVAKEPLAIELATGPEHVGWPITPPEPGEKIFTYSVNGQKVPVAFVKISSGGTNVVVQEKSIGQWFLLKPTSTGKTTKDEIVELLTKVGHTASEPF